MVPEDDAGLAAIECKCKALTGLRIWRTALWKSCKAVLRECTKRRWLGPYKLNTSALTQHALSQSASIKAQSDRLQKTCFTSVTGHAQTELGKYAQVNGDLVNQLARYRESFSGLESAVQVPMPMPPVPPHLVCSLCPLARVFPEPPIANTIILRRCIDPSLRSTDLTCPFARPYSG